MAKKELKPQTITRYQNLIAALANGAVASTEGMSKDLGLVKNKLGLSALRDRNISIFIDGDSVTIDMYVNVEFGYRVPEVICALQEKIKQEVENNTRFEVKKINVHVSSITETNS
jgi:uncharacterized alkaline shock family protein YloU